MLCVCVYMKSKLLFFTNVYAAAAKSLQLCLTLCDPIDSSPPGYPWDSPDKNTGVGCHFLLQCMKAISEVKSLSCVWLVVTPWTAAYQAPLSMGFSRWEYWIRVPLPSLSQVVLLVKKKKKKNPPANAGDARDTGWIPGSGKSPGGGHGNPL